MKLICELCLALVLVVLLNVLAAVLNIDVSALLPGVVCYLFAVWIIEGSWR